MIFTWMLYCTAVAALLGFGAPVQAAEAGALRAADLLLVPAWLLASAGLVLAGCALALALRLRRRGWRWARGAGEAVLVSAATGPAVVGFVRGSIVLPQWVLQWDEERRRMIVEHEREHLRARDPLPACSAAAPGTLAGRPAAARVAIPLSFWLSRAQPTAPPRQP